MSEFRASKISRSTPENAGQTESILPNTKSENTKPVGATFDTSQPLAGMKKLQDPAKFDKARFSFRLYKR